MECLEDAGTSHFVLASSSSVYGEDPHVPWKETQDQLQPISPYAASKLEAERVARAHAKADGPRVTVLRFFTAYGPRQRPDLAIHQFFRRIDAGLPIQQFGDGSTRRDYTFVDDIISGVTGAIDRREGGDFETYNLGNSETVRLCDLIAAVELELGKKAVVEVRSEQTGDVPQTYADISKAGAHFGYRPHTSLARGLRRFHEWYERVAKT
jgi:UDP-glucuronate 4-epimerase